MSKYYIFPIGDWSGDGHSFVAEFLVKGEVSLQKVREIHFQNDWIGKICSEYDNNSLPASVVYNFPNPEEAKKFLVELLNKHGSNVVKDLKDIEHDEVFNYLNMPDDQAQLDDIDITMDYNSLIDFWIFALNQFDENLKLEVVSVAMSPYYIKYKGYPVAKEEIEGNINFYGRDNQGRHLSTPGYGVWSCDETEFYIG